MPLLCASVFRLHKSLGALHAWVSLREHSVRIPSDTAPRAFADFVKLFYSKTMHSSKDLDALCKVPRHRLIQLRDSLDRLCADLRADFSRIDDTAVVKAIEKRLIQGSHIIAATETYETIRVWNKRYRDTSRIFAIADGTTYHQDILVCTSVPMLLPLQASGPFDEAY